MSKAEQFRAKELECDKLADEATNAEAKRLFHEAAANWRSLAEQAERWKW